jgi:CheY-like chemotaxis protein
MAFPGVMAEGRPKLLVLRGSYVQAGEISAALGPTWELVVASPEQAREIMRQTPVQAILAEASDFAALDRNLAGQQGHALLNALGEGVCLADLDGNILWANQRFNQYDPQTRTRITAACRQGVREFERIESQRRDTTPTMGGKRYEVATPDEQHWYEVLVSPVLDEENKKLKHVAAVVWDVTAARRFQGKLESIDRAGQELLRIDAEAVRKMHTGERLRVLEQKIVKYAHDLLNFDQFTIRVIDERNGKLELVMSKGLPQAAMEIPLFAKREGNGISGYVAATGFAYVCPDTSQDPRYVMGIDSARSSLTVPLKIADKVIGVFNVESTKLGAFSQEDLEFAEKFSRPVTLALHLLNLLVVQRVEAGQDVGHTMEEEISAPLAELAADVARLKTALGGSDPALQRAIERVMGEVETVKKRVKDVTSGPQTVLGSEKVLADASVDPVIAGKRVLVADDEPRMRQIIGDVLRARGASVVICENGTSAIEILTGQLPGGSGSGEHHGPGSERMMPTTNERPTDARGFDLLISDIKMPDKTGYEIFAAARVVNTNLPVILMTGFGYDPHHSIVRASQEGLSCVLFKPFQAERLIEEVHKALSKKPA